MLKYRNSLTGVDTLYLHFQKTGGFSFYNVLDQKGISRDWFSEHHGWISMPKEYQLLRKISFIRDPYSWYISFFFFHTNKNKPTKGSFQAMKDGPTNRIRNNKIESKRERAVTPEFRSSPFVEALSGNKTLPFNTFLCNASNLKDFFVKNPDMYDFFLTRMQSYIENSHGWYKTWFINPENCSEELSLDNLDMSLMQWYMNTIGILNDGVDVYKLENFNEIMTLEFGTGFLEPFRNKSDHNNYRHYYNDYTSDLIYESDNIVFSRFNYKKLNLNDPI